MCGIEDRENGRDAVVGLVNAYTKLLEPWLPALLTELRRCYWSCHDELGKHTPRVRMTKSKWPDACSSSLT